MKHDDVIEAVANWFKTRRDVILVAKAYGKAFPNPDIRVQFRNRKVGFVECKPSDAGGREYITGFGQAVAFSVYAEYSYLALPKDEMSKYRRYFWVEDIGLISVESKSVVQLEREAKESKVLAVKEEPRVRGYGYYRDLRPLEIHSILKTIQRTKLSQKRLDIKQIEDSIWKEVLNLRNIRSKRQKASWILNIKLLLRDLQLVNIDDYSLTEDGFRLLQLGNQPNKEPYLKELARCFLINANYIDIVTLIQSINDKHTGFTSIQEFKECLAKAMVNEKLATEKTNLMRDLQDIPRILRDLNIIGEWGKSV